MRASDLTAADLMSTDLVTIREQDTVDHALAKMHARDIRHLPVKDSKGELVGILSNRDLYPVMGTRKAKSMQIRDLMSDEVFTVRPSSPACEITLLLLERKIGALPVVGEDGVLVGLITETDIVRIAHQLLGGDRLSIDEK